MSGVSYDFISWTKDHPGCGPGCKECPTSSELAEKVARAGPVGGSSTKTEAEDRKSAVADRKEKEAASTIGPPKGPTKSAIASDDDDDDDVRSTAATYGGSSPSLSSAGGMSGGASEPSVASSSSSGGGDGYVFRSGK